MQLRTRCNAELTGGVSFRVQKECFIHVYGPVNVEVELKIRLRKRDSHISQSNGIMLYEYQCKLFADKRNTRTYCKKELAKDQICCSHFY